MGSTTLKTSQSLNAMIFWHRRRNGGRELSQAIFLVITGEKSGGSHKIYQVLAVDGSWRIVLVVLGCSEVHLPSFPKIKE